MMDSVNQCAGDREKMTHTCMYAHTQLFSLILLCASITASLCGGLTCASLDW